MGAQERNSFLPFPKVWEHQKFEGTLQRMVVETSSVDLSEEILIPIVEQEKSEIGAVGAL